MMKHTPRTVSNNEAYRTYPHSPDAIRFSIINIASYWYVEHAATLLFSIYMNYTARFGFNRVWNILFDYVLKFSIHSTDIQQCEKINFNRTAFASLLTMASMFVHGFSHSLNHLVHCDRITADFSSLHQSLIDNNPEYTNWTSVTRCQHLESHRAIICRIKA